MPLPGSSVDENSSLIDVFRGFPMNLRVISSLRFRSHSKFSLIVSFLSIVLFLCIHFCTFCDTSLSSKLMYEVYSTRHLMQTYLLRMAEMIVGLHHLNELKMIRVTCNLEIYIISLLSILKGFTNLS